MKIFLWKYNPLYSFVKWWDTETSSWQLSRIATWKLLFIPLGKKEDPLADYQYVPRSKIVIGVE